MNNDLIDVLGAPEIFFDGIHEIRIMEGVVRIALYSRDSSGAKIAAVRLATPVSGLPDVIQAMVMSMAQAAGAMVHPADDSTAH